LSSFAGGDSLSGDFLTGSSFFWYSWREIAYGRDPYLPSFAYLLFLGGQFVLYLGSIPFPRSFRPC
jgi:hypothetical protein